MSNKAELGGGKQFLATGRWAGERLLAAIKAGRPISPAELRTADTLRDREWKAIDDVLIEEGVIRLRGVGDLIAAGLTTPVPNAMGKTIFQWENVSDMNDAEISLSGLSSTEDDSVDFDMGNVPLPIVHKDFTLHLRTLEASRNRGESLDTTQARIAGRLVAEMLEDLLFNGTTKKFGGFDIPGYTTYTHRNVLDFSTAGEGWTAAGKTGEEILNDVIRMKAALEADRMYGPYWLYIPGAYSTAIDKDFKAASDKSIRSRLNEVDGLSKITAVDKLAADNVVMVQATPDVVTLLDGEGLQSIQWDIEGGFRIKFKAFAIQIPLIRSDASNRCGICHMSAQ